MHLDGACRLETLMDLARQSNLSYPYNDKEQFKSWVALVNPAPSLADFLKVFTAIGNILKYVHILYVHVCVCVLLLRHRSRVWSNSVTFAFRASNCCEDTVLVLSVCVCVWVVP